jgi:hypothetical protein
LKSGYAGASHTVPDAIITTTTKKKIPLEIKLNLGADFGQLNLTYGPQGWTWSTKSQNNLMQHYYNNLSIDYNGHNYNNILDLLNADPVWGNKPEKFILDSQNTQDYINGWLKDKQKYKNIIIYIPFSTITTFYSNKQFPGLPVSNYIQIGHSKYSNANPDGKKSLGLYYLEDKNQHPDLKGSDISKFESKFEPKGPSVGPCCKLRIRLKTNSSGTGGDKPSWSFLVALQCVKIPKSSCSLDDKSRWNGIDKKISLI